MPARFKKQYAEPWQGSRTFAQQYIQPFLQTGIQTTGQLQNLIAGLPTIPSTYETLGGQYISQVLGGTYLTPEAIKATYEPLAQQYREELNRALADIRSRFIGAGAPESSAAGLAMSETATKSLADLQNLYANLMLQERARQQALLPVALQYGMMPYQRAAQLAQLQSAIPSILGGYTQLYGALQPQVFAQWVQEPGFWDYFSNIAGNVLGGAASGLGMAMGTKLFK